MCDAFCRRANEWGYFRLRLVDPNMSLKVSLVEVKDGDPDLYISTKTDKVSGFLFFFFFFFFFSFNFM